MPSEEDIQNAQQELYEVASIRDDLDDDEASVLLKWGEQQIARIAQETPENFAQRVRFLRTLMQRINRFVGQRPYLDEKGYAQHFGEVVKWLAPTGFDHVNEIQLTAVLPEDKEDRTATLKAILNALTPDETSLEEEESLDNMETQVDMSEQIGNLWRRLTGKGQPADKEEESNSTEEQE